MLASKIFLGYHTKEMQIIAGKIPSGNRKLPTKVIHGNDNTLYNWLCNKIHLLED